MKSRKNERTRLPIVDVADEPNHVEIFRNDRMRAYVATVEPGARTLPHRHSRDTLYVVLAGGRMTTRVLEGKSSGSYVFPRSFPAWRAAWWGMQTALTGSCGMPDGAFFLQTAEGAPISHEVSAPRRNRRAVRMLGVELIRRGERRRAAAGGGRDVEYADAEFEIRKIEMPRGTAPVEEIRIDPRGALSIRLEAGSLKVSYLILRTV